MGSFVESTYPLRAARADRIAALRHVVIAKRIIRLHLRQCERSSNFSNGFVNSTQNFCKRFGDRTKCFNRSIDDFFGFFHYFCLLFSRKRPKPFETLFIGFENECFFYTAHIILLFVERSTLGQDGE